MNDPNVVDWITAIGQVVGSLGTLAAVVVALAIARRDGRRIEKERRDRDTAQARLITSRLDEDWRTIKSGTDSHVVVRNNSNQAISNLQIVDVVAQPLGLRMTLHPENRDSSELLRPNETAEFAGVWSGTDHINASGHNDFTAVDIRIQFVDASGLWWQRVNNAGVVRSRTRAEPKLEWVEMRDLPASADTEGANVRES